MSKRPRARALAAVGAAVGAAGLAYAAWRYFATPDDDRPRPSGSVDKGKGKTPLKHKGTLSLHSPDLPPLELLEALCRHFTVHLLLRAPSSPSPESSPYAAPDVPPQLLSVEGLDARRILFYSRSEGRLHVARALACDVHVEVWPSSSSGGSPKIGTASANGQEGSWVMPERDLTLPKLVHDLRTFVGTLVVVSSAEDAKDLEAPNLRTVRTLKEAVSLVCST